MKKFLPAFFRLDFDIGLIIFVHLQSRFYLNNKHGEMLQSLYRINSL